MVNQKEYTRKELAIARRKCDESLLFFTRFFYKQLRGTKFIVSDHHKVICNELKRVENYELELLNINIPPRFSKTELAAVNKIARGIGMNPTANYLYITASDELRAQTSVSIRDIVTHPYFKIMYGTELKKDQNGKNLWRTKQGGGLKTATIFGQITGFGAGQMIDHDSELEDYIRTFEGCIVLDDVNKIDDSGQENANNDKVSRVIFNTIFSRKNSKDTPIINIQQRAGMQDATAQLMEHFGEDNPKTKFLVMPVVSSDGVPLWEWKHDLAEIEILRTSEKTKANFATQYMQEPVDIKGILIPFSRISFVPKSKNEDDIIARLAFCDPAELGGDSLSTIFIELTYRDDVFRVHILDVVHNKFGSSGNAHRIIDKLAEHKIERIFVEGNGVGVAMLSELRHIGTNTVIQGYKEKMNKEQKINAFYDFVLDYFTYDEDKYNDSAEFKDFIKHLTTYSKEGVNKNRKDAIDVCSAAARNLKIKYSSYIYKS